ncbi:hypothetical protein [Arthrobacter sp. CG_A4]|uniref:hypothetical protein n=1 Tax=Arthrobacter sp. CG_A4 TaxID=3071706 RepID=UPI002E137B8A
MLAERGAYILTVGASLSVPVAALTAQDPVSGALSLFSLAVTCFGAAVGVTIYRVQSKKTYLDSIAQTELLGAIGNASERAASHSEVAAVSSLKSEQFLEQMQSARAAANLPAPEELLGEPTEPEPVLSEPSTDEPVADDDRLEEKDGEYRRPAAVPLGVLADLVQWWRGSGGSSGKWNVGNLVGSYRPYNKAGNLQGVPWILTFRRSNGELTEYRISYSGRKRIDQSSATPTVSRYSSDEKKWIDGEPAIMAESR